MSVTFTRTREQLAILALRKLGVLSLNETPSPEDSALAYEAIDMRIKEMHRLGTFWRKVTPTASTFTITANVASAAHGLTDLLYPVLMQVTVNGRDEPVKIISVPEYNSINVKTQKGEPEVAVQSGANFIFWPVPTANRTARIVYQKIGDDTAAGVQPDVEVSMLRWLRDLIAYDMMDYFAVTPEQAARFPIEADIAEKKIRAINAPRTDYLPVAVDDFGSSFHYESDYGR